MEEELDIINSVLDLSAAKPLSIDQSDLKNLRNKLKKEDKVTLIQSRLSKFINNHSTYIEK